MRNIGLKLSILAVAVVLALSLAAVQAQASTLVMRWDASVLSYADGTPVSAWASTVGTATFTQTNPDKQPVFNNNMFGNGKGVWFDGDYRDSRFPPDRSDTMSAGDLSGLLPIHASATLYAVFRPADMWGSGTDGQYNIVTTGTSGGDPDWYLQADLVTNSYNNVFRTSQASGINVGPNATGRLLWSIDGKPAGNDLYVGGLFKGTNTNGDFYVGNNWQLSATEASWNNYFGGNINEILVFDGAVSEDERAGLDYLMNVKWDLGLTLDAEPEQIAAAEALLVPEPTTMALLAFGGLGLLLKRRRR